MKDQYLIKLGELYLIEHNESVMKWNRNRSDALKFTDWERACEIAEEIRASVVMVHPAFDGKVMAG